MQFNLIERVSWRGSLNHTTRPSHRELTGKINEALEAAHACRIAIIEPEVIAMDALELGYSIENELQIVLLELLNATVPEDYDGRRPPEKSYKKQIKDSDLFAFCLGINRFSIDVYYKFAIKNPLLWLVSLHNSRKK
jgi:hypothetical protein